MALLSPILFPLYIMLVDPPDPEEAPSTLARAPFKLGRLVHLGAVGQLRRTQACLVAALQVQRLGSTRCCLLARHTAAPASNPLRQAPAAF